MKGCPREEKTMPVNPQRVQEIFLAAVAQSDRATYLDRECGPLAD